MRGKVLITGGAGYLGRVTLQSLIWEGGYSDVTVYSRDEMKQWELQRAFPGVRCILGDVRDRDRLEAAMAGHDTVLHAGAVKFIPEAEHNVAETIGVNVDGSLNVLLAAVRTNVRKVICVSTDKACAPQTTYGVTKLLMERLVSEAAGRWGHLGTSFACVRYGNVVGSTGSVIPLFRRQLQETGRIKITDNRMTRFWLAPRQAVQVIEWAEHNLDYGPSVSNGAIFVPACPAMTILELARCVYELWSEKLTGQVVDPGFETDEIGIRPGEKLHEVLVTIDELQRDLSPEGFEGARVPGMPPGWVIAPPTRRGAIPALAALVEGDYSSQDAAAIPSGLMKQWISEAEKI